MAARYEELARSTEYVARTNGQLRWVMVAFIFSGGLISYIDRAVFGLLAPDMGRDLGLDPGRIGLALSAFSIGYTVCTVIGGWATDRFGSRRTILVSMTFWSLLCAMTGFVGGFWSLLAVRGAFGAGEAPWISASNKVLAQWFSRERFASVYGFCAAGQPLGGMVGGPIVGGAAYLFGWRGGFITVGCLGLIWAVLWLLLAKDPPLPAEPVFVDAEPLRSSGPVSPLADRATFKVLANPTIIAVGLCMGTAAYLLTFFLSWFPSYLTKSFSLNVGELGLVTAIPWLVGALGLAGGGAMADGLGREIGDPIRSRKIVLMACLSVAAATVCVMPWVKSLSAAVAIMAITIGAMYMAATTYFAIALEVSPRQHFGIVSGVMLLVANIAAGVAPAATGYIIKSTGSYDAAFWTAGAVLFAGMLIVAMFVRSPRTRALLD